MYGLIVFILCFLLEAMLKEHGASAWLWAPVGFVLGSLVAVQIASPLLIDLPRAIWLIAKGRMHMTVCGPILLKPILRFAALFLVGLFWATALDHIDNSAVHLGASLGTFVILFSLLWAKSRSNFVASFNTTYGTFFTATGWALFLAEAKAAQQGAQAIGPASGGSAA